MDKIEKYLRSNRTSLEDKSKLTTDEAKRLYGVLVKCCGASPRKHNRESFIYHYAVCSSSECEFVFKSNSGDHWTFISDGSGVRVSLYEKENKRSLEAESRANMILQGLLRRIRTEFKTSDGLEFKRK